MNGLMNVNRIDPHEFLAFVHEVDLACVPQDPALAGAIAKLHGRKIVFTNGSVRHAERLLEHLGIGHEFTGIIDIVACAFDPKPAIDRLSRTCCIGTRSRRPTAGRADGRGHGPQPRSPGGRGFGMTTAWVP